MLTQSRNPKRTSQHQFDFQQTPKTKTNQLTKSSSSSTNHCLTLLTGLILTWFIRVDTFIHSISRLTAIDFNPLVPFQLQLKFYRIHSMMKRSKPTVLQIESFKNPSKNLQKIWKTHQNWNNPKNPEKSLKNPEKFHKILWKFSSKCLQNVKESQKFWKIPKNPSKIPSIIPSKWERSPKIILMKNPKTLKGTQKSWKILQKSFSKCHQNWSHP